MSQMASSLVAACLTAACVCASAAGLPDLVVPAGVGVNIHFTRGHTQDLDRIAAAGFKWIRMDFGWGSIERTKGQYDWTAYDELTANLDQRGLRAIYILDYSNSLYEETVTARNPVTGQEQQRDTASPQHPESVAAFARWAAAAAHHFRGRGILWEIWNEPNITFWKPKPDVQQYVTLALATVQAVREVDPQALIIAPATSELPFPFLERVFAAGLLDRLDAVSVHPYRDYRKGPETALEDYARLRELIRKHTPAGKRPLPIISGEWGYSSHAKGVSLETQAAFLVRQQLANLLAGVPISIWYDWKNDGPDANEREHNFGTVFPDLRPKPAYTALQVMTRELAGCRIQRRIVTPNDQEYVLLFNPAKGNPRLAAWTAGAPAEVVIPVKVQRRASVKGVTGLGQPFGVELDRQGRASLVAESATSSGPEAAVRLEAGQLRIRLGPMPVYLTLDGVTLRKQ